MEQQTYISLLSINRLFSLFEIKKAGSQLLLVFILLFPLITFSQINLVPNGSFETYTACPNSFSLIQMAPPWRGTNNSSELFNLCGTSSANAPNTAYGYQNARSGGAYAGQYFMNDYGSNSREYIQVPLTSSLNAGSCYFVKFYVNCVNKVINFACNNFAAHLSVGGYTTNNLGFPATTFTPQVYMVNNPIINDTLNWIEIGGVFTASGGENYLTIGNFKNDANTDTLRTNNGSINAAYYYIDDVSVEQITTSTWQLRDTMIIGGDSVLIGPLYSGLTCSWFDMSANPIGNGAGIWVKPTTTTSYILQQTFCNNTFSDTMTVYVSAVGINNSIIKNELIIYPQPAEKYLNVKITSLESSNFEIRIKDVYGKAIAMNKADSHKETVSINVESFPNGIYFLEAISNKECIKREIIINK